MGSAPVAHAEQCTFFNASPVIHQMFENKKFQMVSLSHVVF